VLARGWFRGKCSTQTGAASRRRWTSFAVTLH